MRHLFYDTEFLEDGRTIDLLSIGLVDDLGRELYAINADFPLYRLANEPWLCENVVPSLPIDPPTARLGDPAGGQLIHRWSRNHPDAHRLRTCRQIAEEVWRFVAPADSELRDVELWAYYGAYDHVALAQLFGRMIELPAGVPMFTRELMQLWEQAGKPEKPPQSGEHHALADARWNRALWVACQ